MHHSFSVQFLFAKSFSPTVPRLGRGMVTSGACPSVREARGIAVSPSSSSWHHHLAHGEGETTKTLWGCILDFSKLSFQSALQTWELFWIFLLNIPVFHIARVQLLLLEIEECPAGKKGKWWGCCAVWEVLLVMFYATPIFNIIVLLLATYDCLKLKVLAHESGKCVHIYPLCNLKVLQRKHLQSSNFCG